MSNRGWVKRVDIVWMMMVVPLVSLVVACVQVSEDDLAGAEDRVEARVREAVVYQPQVF